MPSDISSLSVGITVPFVVICVLSFLIRIYARKRIAGPLGKDDWFMILAFAAWIGQQTILYKGVRLGAGKHQSQVPIENISLLQKYLFAEEFYYHFTQLLIKQSFLLFYLRFLGTTVWRYAIIFTMCLVFLQVGGTWIFYGLHCIPIQALFHPEEHPQATCLDIGVAYYAPSVANVLVDIIIYAIPIKPLLHQRLSPERRLRILLVMILGACTIIIAGLRFIVLYQLATDENSTYIYGRVVIITTIEFVTAIVTANIPAMSIAYQHHFCPDAMSGDWEHELTDTSQNANASRRSSSRFAFRKPGLGAIPITRNKVKVTTGTGTISPAFDHCNSPTDSEMDLVKEPGVLVTSKWEIREEDAARRELNTPSPQGFRLRSDV